MPLHHCAMFVNVFPADCETPVAFNDATLSIVGIFAHVRIAMSPPSCVVHVTHAAFAIVPPMCRITTAGDFTKLHSLIVIDTKIHRKYLSA